MLEQYFALQASKRREIRESASTLEFWYDDWRSAERLKVIQRNQEMRVANQADFLQRTLALPTTLPKYLILASTTYENVGKFHGDMTDAIYTTFHGRLMLELPKLALIDVWDSRSFPHSHLVKDEEFWTQFSDQAARVEFLIRHESTWQRLFDMDYKITKLLHSYGFLLVQPLGGRAFGNKLYNVLIRSWGYQDWHDKERMAETDDVDAYSLLERKLYNLYRKSHLGVSALKRGNEDYWRSLMAARIAADLNVDRSWTWLL
jgi:hypothetical protein